MAGMVAARSCPAFREPYRAIRAAGKPAKVAIVTSGRRLVMLANALVRDDTMFEASKLQKGQEETSQDEASVSNGEMEA